MGQPAFDTLNIAKELERDFGFEQKQAEGAAVMIHRHLVGNVATKDDIKDVRKDIQHVEEKLSGEIKLMGRDMTIRLGGLVVGVIVIFETLNRFFPIMP